MNKVLVIGQVFVDIIIQDNQELKLRLGGIIHAARALWAIKKEYDIAYFAPEYLDKSISKYLKDIQCKGITKIGNIIGCPNIQLIKNAKETSDQLYEDILYEEREDQLNIQIFLTLIKSGQYKKILIFPGGFNIHGILELLSSFQIDILIDINFEDIESCGYAKKFHTIILSTSSKIFLEKFRQNLAELTDNYREKTERLIFKENRGGTRFLNFIDNTELNIPSYTTTITHSVGVGDCFNAVYASLYDEFDTELLLKYSAMIAAEYAITTFPNDFMEAVQSWMKINSAEFQSIKGTILPYEKRKNIHIYIAGPDFDYIDTKEIDKLENSLKYHNFSAHRPIKENGQCELNATAEEKYKLMNGDLELLNRCHILVAVMLYNDPGTLVELGLAIERDMLTIVFDPYHKVENLLLSKLPSLVTSDIDEILTVIFNKFGQ